MKKILSTGLLLVSLTSCSFFGVGSEEQPSYEIILKQNDKEIRKYSSYIVAKATVEGSFEDAQKQGFRILAGYIFGKNKAKQKISMTAPVVQKAEGESEKISMTAPVTIQNSQKNVWTMTFSMPSKFTLETLPEPEDKRIQFEKMEARFVAVTTFSGFWSEEKNNKKGKALSSWMKDKSDYSLKSIPYFAGYNPPWTLPFMRRNEVMIELQKN